jgi:hypothetical protein
MVDRKDSGVVNDVRSSRYDPRAQQCISVIRLAIPGSHPQQREGQSESAAARRQRVLYDMAGAARPQEGNRTAQAGLGQVHPVFLSLPVEQAFFIAV